MIGYIIGVIIGFLMAIICFGEDFNNKRDFVNTNEYKVETKTEVVNSDTTKYIRIIKK